MTDEHETKEELYEEAKELGVEGRSKMDRDELEKAVREAEGEEAQAPAQTQAAADEDTEVEDQSKKMDPADDIVSPKEVERIETGWKRGAELDDAEGIAAAEEEARLANMGSTGTTGYAAVPDSDVSVGEVAAEAAAIRQAAIERNLEKVEQSGPTAEHTAVPAEGADSE